MSSSTHANLPTAQSLCSDGLVATAHPVIGTQSENVTRRVLLRSQNGNAVEAIFFIHDPKHRVPNLLAPFESAFSNSLLRDRLALIHRRLKTRKQNVKITLDGFETVWALYPNTNNRVPQWHLYINGSLNENIELSLVGLISQVFFQELIYQFPLLWSDLLENQVQSLAKQGYQHWKESDLKNHVKEVLRLRTTWLNKESLYRDFKQKGCSYEDPFLEKVIKLRRDSGNEAADKFVFESFVEFYHLESELTAYLWTIPLPDLWELAFAAPLTVPD